MYRVNWGSADEPFPGLNDSAGNTYLSDTTLILRDLEPGVEYKVRVRGGTNPFSDTAVQRIDDYGSDEYTEATVTVGEFKEGRVDSAGDEDWFAVSLEAEESYHVVAEGDTGVGARLTGLYDERGEEVGAGVRWSGVTALVFTPTANGAYYVSVGGTEGRTGEYEVSVYEGEPEGLITGLGLRSDAAGMLTVTWDRASPSAEGYRLSWARVDENYRLWADDAGNAYPAETSRTLVGLDSDEVYKVRVRARYPEGVNGPWGGGYARAAGSVETDSGPSRGAETPERPSSVDPVTPPALTFVPREEDDPPVAQQEDVDPATPPTLTVIPSDSEEDDPPVAQQEDVDPVTLSTLTFIPSDSEEEYPLVAQQQTGGACSSSCLNSSACTPTSSNTCKTVFYETMARQQQTIDELVASLTVYDGTTASGGSGGGSYNITIECGDPAHLANGRASCSCTGTRCDRAKLLGIVVDGDGEKEAQFINDPDLPNGLRVQNVLNGMTDHLNQAVGTKGEMERSGGDRCDGGDPSPNTCFPTGGASTSHRTWLGESRCGCSFIDWVIRIQEAHL